MTLPESNLVTLVPFCNSKSYFASVNVKADVTAAEIYTPILPDASGSNPADPRKFNPVPSAANFLLTKTSGLIAVVG